MVQETENLQDFAFAFQCFMLEYWDREDTGRWPKNPSLSPNVSDDPVLMQDLLTELGKMEPNQEGNPWVCLLHFFLNGSIPNESTLKRLNVALSGTGSICCCLFQITSQKSCSNRTSSLGRGIL